jgi:hypothetical protein
MAVNALLGLERGEELVPHFRPFSRRAFGMLWKRIIRA